MSKPKFDFPKLIDFIREEMSWNMGDPENDCYLPTKDQYDNDKSCWDADEDSHKHEEVFIYNCYAGESIIGEMREALKVFDPRLKLITLVKNMYGDYHDYAFAVRFRVGQEPDDEIIDDADYSEAGFKMDKFMSEDPEDMKRFDEVLESKDIDSVVAEIELICVDEDRMHSYFNGGNIRGFAEYLISR